MIGSDATDDQIHQQGLFFKPSLHSNSIKKFQMSPFFRDILYDGKIE